MTILAPRLIDFLGAGSPTAGAMLGWPVEFLQQVEVDLNALRAGQPITPEAREAYRAHGLVDAEGRLTIPGRRLAYNIFEHNQQSVDPQLKAFLDRAELGHGAKVLDIGCASGQTLRVVAGREPTECIGVDMALESLALGRRLSDLEGREITFIHCSGHALPFRDHHFSHVISRGALNYMHQETGLKEIVRVLQPGGFLFLRYEALRHDIAKVLHAAGFRDFVCRTRDLGIGVVLALTGWQREPWRFLGGGRTFVSPRRLAKVLRRGGMETILIEPATQCPIFLGRPTQTSLLVRRLS
jgi:SAM-dependent methyltransferase